jgi:vancomycin resistance protein YoaR
MKKRYSSSEKSGNAVVIILIAVVAVLIIGAATYFIATREPKLSVDNPQGGTLQLTVSEMKELLDVNTFYKGITIDGIDVSGMTVEEALAMFGGGTSEVMPAINIKLSVQGQLFALDSTKIGIHTNLTEMIQEAFDYARTSEEKSSDDAYVDRYNKYLQLQETTKNFTTGYSADTELLTAEIKNILDPLQTEVKDAVLQGFDVNLITFVIDPSVVGLVLDADTAIADVQLAIETKMYDKIISVNATVTEPAIKTEDIAANLVLVSSTTTTTTSDKNRNSNINLVCETINGLVLQPGEFFNYNDVVGKRTAEKGYKEAGGIFDGALRLELGGGICQVSGTMYHSVLKANLQVDERHPHSWPSAYVPIGTDATVTWGGSNFQFTNNTEYPIAIHAVFKDKPDNTGKGEVTVQIFGRPLEPGMTIEVEGKVLSTTPPGVPEYVADPLMFVGTPNTVIREQHDAISAEAYQVFYKDGVEVARVKASASYYRPITAKFGVGAVDPITLEVYPVDPVTGVVLMPVTPVPTGVPSPTP